MKLHAGVGADILSAIDFPYPVVPIVRHHHENWDGTGYPTGIKGTDIPIGARILSVVDCFDALTSDRPYRPALSDEEALRILAERRGTMYDPLIVDTFTQVYAEIAPQSLPTIVPRAVLSEITSATHPSPRPEAKTAAPSPNALEALTMYELSRVLAEPRGFRGTGDLVLKHLRRLVAFNQAAVFVYEVAADDMVARHGMGDISDAIVGLRMPLGHRLSGWVAANRSMIVNSDPALDLGEIATTEGLKLRSCMSAPLVSDGQLVGVLTLYSEIPDGFTEDDRRILEAVVAQTSDAFRRAVGVDDPDPRLEPASVRVRTSAEGAALPSAARS
jgi:hypothetical protein